MRSLPHLLAASAAILALSACTSRGGAFADAQTDRFAVTRTAPLVIPPDFAAAPPRPGEPGSAAEARTQPLQSAFGGAAPRSDVERSLLQRAEADRAAAGARSVAGDPDTRVIDRGTLSLTILQMPEGDGQEAAVRVPQ
ncbi:MAG: DUF3035 domain-containing protein [Allosphingosinicella sp.]|uniref:DUF3035 domain-containing protein n=1 Tax=Allosphingosinicella sp. TaxID=2823234 RepID=UPI00392469F7